MADLDPFALVRRLGNAPLGPLVDALRQIHQRGSADSNNLEALLGLRDAPAALKNAAPTVKSTSTDYEAARRHFVRHSERLREQAILAERLLDGLAGHAHQTTPVALQQELRILCGPEDSSAARFVVANCLNRTVNVRFRPGHIHGLPPEHAASIRLSFDPEQPRLEPGAEQEVKLRVELANSDGLPDVLELGVDVLGNEQMLLKLWVRIERRQGRT